MRNLTIDEAYELALDKWQWIKDNDGEEDSDKMYRDLPELKGFIADCAYCELFNKELRARREKDTHYYGEYPCDGCPLDIFPLPFETGCSHEHHPYQIWSENFNQDTDIEKRRALAQGVIDLIKEQKPRPVEPVNASEDGLEANR